MKINLVWRVILSGFIFLMMAQFTHAQTSSSTNPANAEQTNSAVETMGEDDRLPFMHDERGGAAAPGATESSPSGMLLRTLGAMLLIVGLIFCGAWGLKKFGAKFGLLHASNLNKPDSPDLVVLNSVSLGNNRTLAVVRFGERNLLVGSTAHSFTLLADETRGSETVLPPNRSVADLLAEENNLFADELHAADARLSIFSQPTNLS